MLIPRLPSMIAAFLVLSALLSWPAFGRADCGCGPGCGCGDGCTCGQWTQAPPRDPNANNVRKNQRNLTDDEKQAFVAAVLQLKASFHDGATLSIYDEYVQAHAMMMMFQPIDIHRSAAFFPWHRAWLDQIERELQAIDPSVTIPYWDFTVDTSPDAAPWTDDFLGGDGDPDDNDVVKTGPFRQGEWVIPLELEGPDLRRTLGRGPFGITTLPTPEQWETAKTIPTYDVFPFDEGSPVDESFRNYMAGWNQPESAMHNRVHLWVGGSMGLMASPNDPIFLCHHSNLDRLWYEWEKINGYQYPKDDPLYGQDINWVMPPFGVTTGSMLDHHDLGYVYDTEMGCSPRPGNGSGPSGRKVSVTTVVPAERTDPVDLPAWFRDLAGKNGGQIGLAEWRSAGRSVAEFRKIDLNNDGFITADEVRRFLAGGRK